MTQYPFSPGDTCNYDPLGAPDAEFEPADPYPRSTNYLDGLNLVQRQAVDALDGPVLLLAGAGTGKTRVLTSRLAHLLTTRRATPFQVLAVTFTNKASREMRDRVASLVGGNVEGWWLGTFHALAARMLRRHADLVGLTSSFTILDSDDQLRLVKQILEIENINIKKWPPRQVLSIFERWKDRGLSPGKVTAREAGDAVNGSAIALYAAYQNRLKILNACDFGDLMLHTLTVFQSHQDILAEYHRRFRYILVDEYQDTNVAQYLWLRLLAQGHNNICCVGDEDQSIYGWRGAEIGNILRFENDFPGATVIRLEENYRSTGHILGAATGLIANNRSRLGKTLWTAGGEGDKVRVKSLSDSREEAHWVGDEIASFNHKGTRLGQIAILVRTSAQTRSFEERILALGLAYRVVGGLRFYERQEIRDVLAYLRVINQPADDLAFERIINLPKRGIGQVTLTQLSQFGHAHDIAMTTTARIFIETDKFKPKPCQTMRNLLDSFERWRGLAKDLHHTELARLVLDESGYTKMWQDDESPEAPGRLENLKELVTGMADYENLQDFLEHVALVMEANEGSGEDKISIMTLHGAKGLEFDVVFLPGWEEGLFPSKRAIDEKGQAGLEEERRLAYVGLTRARSRAIVCCAERRRLWADWLNALPSRFIFELLPEHIDSNVQIPPLNDYDTREAMAQCRPPFRAPMVDGSTRRANIKSQSCPYAPGSRVVHAKFGLGTVVEVDCDKLQIEFDQAGSKTLLEAFVNPAE
ncbi:MAG: UvrD-helicase domain-containing protein [Rhodospirillaceae bacterium]